MHRVLLIKIKIGPRYLFIPIYLSMLVLHSAFSKNSFYYEVTGIRISDKQMRTLNLRTRVRTDQAGRVFVHL